MLIIHYTIPGQATRTYKSTAAEVLIGRDAGFDNPLDLDLAPDNTVSHRHARLELREGTLWIEDLHSTNGTFINEQRIQGKVRLPAGTPVRLGQTEMRIEVQTPDTVPEEPPDAEAPPVAATTLFVAGSEGEEGERFTETSEPDWQRLKAFYRLSRSLAHAKDISITLQMLVRQLREAIPNARRGALLLAEQNDRLLLKAHWPRGSQSVSTTLAQEAFREHTAFIWSTSTDRRTKSSPSMELTRVQAAIYAPLLFENEALGVLFVDNDQDPHAFSGEDLALLQAIADQTAIFIKKQRLRQDLRRDEILRANLSRQFSPQLTEQMLEEYNRLRLGGERVAPVTTLISDIRNFTVLSADLAPESVVRMLNEMFDAFVPIIFDHDGVVDKYIGDAVLAVFGSPEPDDDQWEKAVRAALEMQQAMRKLGEGWRVRRLPIFQVGIGIHSGEIIHGFIGPAERTEYTIIGDTVNRTSRYCSGAGPGEIIISPAVYERIYRLVNVEARQIQTKHPEKEPVMEAYLIKGLSSYARGD
ncbi:MAG: adenylate/guanylate cyclase domain-containing protein [Anaerolineae bacterium]